MLENEIAAISSKQIKLNSSIASCKTLIDNFEELRQFASAESDIACEVIQNFVSNFSIAEMKAIDTMKSLTSDQETQTVELLPTTSNDCSLDRIEKKLRSNYF